MLTVTKELVQNHIENDKYHFYHLRMECPLNPRKDIDHFTKFIMSHNKYEFGDETLKTEYDSTWIAAFRRYCLHEYKAEIVLDTKTPIKTGRLINCLSYEDDIPSLVGLRLKNWMDDNVIFKSVSLYDHSGQSISYGEQFGWDAGQIGFMYTTKTKLREAYMRPNITKKFIASTIEKTFMHELDHMNSYLAGTLDEIIVIDKSDNEHVEHLDHLFGDMEIQQTLIDLQKTYK